MGTSNDNCPCCRSTSRCTLSPRSRPRNWKDTNGKELAGRRQHHQDVVRPLHHVPVGDDVSVGVNDESASDRFLPSDHDTRVAALCLLDGAKAGNQYLHHARRYLADERPHGLIYFSQFVVFGLLRPDRACAPETSRYCQHHAAWFYGFAYETLKHDALSFPSDAAVLPALVRLPKLLLGVHGQPGPREILQRSILVSGPRVRVALEGYR